MYRRRYYKNWRYREYKPTIYQELYGLFGDAVSDIRQSFLDFDEETLNELLIDYESFYGKSAKKYAKNTFTNWKSGKTKLSGKTMERLIELVPPYLSTDQRINILEKVVKKYEPTKQSRTIRINIKEPINGFNEINVILNEMKIPEDIAFIPEKVMKAGTWLYDNDMTAARAMIVEIKKKRNSILKLNATKEINLLKESILSGKITSATYNINLPSGNLTILTYEPSNCFIATVCFGEPSIEIDILKKWRDYNLRKNVLGCIFIEWYYKNGTFWASLIEKSTFWKSIIRFFLKIFISFIKRGMKFEK